MKSYFHNCLSTLENDGILLVDSFGGSQCYGANEEKSSRGSFIYYWDQTSFDPIHNHAFISYSFQAQGIQKNQQSFYL